MAPVAVANQIPAPQAPFGATLVRWAVPVLAAGVFLSPYVAWRFVPSILFTFSDGLFCFAALLLLGGGALKVRSLDDFTAVWMIGLGAMLLGLLVSSLLFGSGLRWLIVAAQYSFAYGLLPMLLFVGGRETALHFAKALLAGVAAMELFGITIYYGWEPSHSEAGLIAHEFITGSRRLAAFLGDPNWNAAMIALTLPFVLYLARIGRLGVLSAVLALMILVFGLLLSGSVTGLTSCAGAALVFLAVSGGTWSFRVFLVIVFVVSIVMGGGFELPVAFENRVQGAIAGGDITQAGTFNDRLELVEEAWALVSETMLIGLGADQYRLVSHHQAPVHNIFLLMWTEGGLLALFGWVLMITVPLIAAIRHWSDNRSTVALMLAVWCAFVIFSTAAPHLYARCWSVPLLIPLALLLARTGFRECRKGLPLSDEDYRQRPATAS